MSSQQSREWGWKRTLQPQMNTALADFLAVNFLWWPQVITIKLNYFLTFRNGEIINVCFQVKKKKDFISKGTGEQWELALPGLLHGSPRHHTDTPVADGNLRTRQGSELYRYWFIHVLLLDLVSPDSQSTHRSHLALPRSPWTVTYRGVTNWSFISCLMCVDPREGDVYRISLAFMSHHKLDVIGLGNIQLMFNLNTFQDGNNDLAEKNMDSVIGSLEEHVENNSVPLM